MRGAFALALLCLTACDDSSKQEDATTIAMQSGMHSAQIDDLQTRVARLENQLNQVDAQERLDAASQTEQLSSLTNTFNKDVKIDNDRAHGTYYLIQQVDRRLSRYDGQRTTTD
jgi:outer membrane murein-binding lipoprotein Lpp